MAIDLALAAPLESGLRICLLASRLAGRVGADHDELRRTYDLALLRHIGCTADNSELAAVVGDERAYIGGMGGLDVTSKSRDAVVPGAGRGGFAPARTTPGGTAARAGEGRHVE